MTNLKSLFYPIFLVYFIKWVKKKKNPENESTVFNEEKYKS